MKNNFFNFNQKHFHLKEQYTCVLVSCQYIELFHTIFNYSKSVEKYDSNETYIVFFDITVLNLSYFRLRESIPKHHRNKVPVRLNKLLCKCESGKGKLSKTVEQSGGFRQKDSGNVIFSRDNAYNTLNIAIDNAMEISLT